LFYLVSNAFERKRQVAILGMERFISTKSQDPNKELMDEDVAALFRQNINGWPSLVIAGEGARSTRIAPGRAFCKYATSYFGLCPTETVAVGST